MHLLEKIKEDQFKLGSSKFTYVCGVHDFGDSVEIDAYNDFTKSVPFMIIDNFRFMYTPEGWVSWEYDYETATVYNIRINKFRLYVKLYRNRSLVFRSKSGISVEVLMDLSSVPYSDIA